MGDEAAAPLSFGLLGPFEVWRGREQLGLSQHKQRALLAVLVMDANRVVSLDRLIDLLWGEEPPARATAALQVYISGLRRALEPHRPARAPSEVLATIPPGYVLKVEPGAYDVDRFASLAARGRRLLAEGRPERALQALGSALAQWRGQALADFAFEPFAQAEAARLEELRAMTIEDRLEASLALGYHAQSVGEIEALVLDRPLSERTWGLLMLALYRSARQGEALRAFGRARTVLGEELGIEPGPALRRLEAAILNQEPSLEWLPPAEVEGPLTDEGLPAEVAPGAEAVEAADEAVEAASAAPDAGRPARRPGLVGRNGPIRALDAVVARAAGGDGGLALVTGEPGIGKTRLVEEVARRATAMGATVTWGRCHEGEDAPAYWPWVQVVRSLLEDTDDEEARRAIGPVAAEIAPLVPEVGGLVGDADPPVPLDSAAARFRRSDALAGVVLRLAGGRPLVVILDDLQWADDPSLGVLGLLAARLPTTTVLVVGTYRDVDPAVAGGLGRTLGELSRGSVLTRVRLEGLAEDEVGRVIADAAGTDATPEVVSAVWARTDGNPFFVVELARLLGAERALGGGPGRASAIPAAVRDVIRLRLARLPETTNQLLSVAAVCGRDADVRVVAAAAEVSEVEALEHLDPAVAVGLIVEDRSGGGRYRFCHALVQETIREELPSHHRVRASARIADALTVLHGDDPAHALQLAHHLFDAAPLLGPDRGLSAALRAAEIAQAALADEQAELQLRRALDLALRLPAGNERDRRELEVHQRVGTLLSMTRGYNDPGVTAAWARALELCREMDDTEEILASLWGQCRAARTGARYDVLDALGRELLEARHGSPGPAFVLAGHEARGVAALFKGDLAAADRHLAEVVARAGESGGAQVARGIDPAVVGRVYLAVTRVLLGRDDEADTLMAQARQLGGADGDRFNEVLALLSEAMIACLRGDVDETRTGTEAVLAHHRRSGVGPLALLAEAWNGWARVRRGEPEGDVDLARASARLLAEGGRQNRTWLLGLRADSHRVAGRLDDALVAVDEGLDEADRTGERFYEAELHRLRGELVAARWPERQEEARGHLARAVAVADAQGADAFRRRAAASQAALVPPIRLLLPEP